MLWTSDEVSVLDRIIFLEDLKMVMEAMTTCLDNKELVVMTMKNYDGVSFGQIQEYFKTNREEKLSEYMVKNLEERAMKKVRRNLKFRSWGH
jgi:hypothetical protein